MRGVRKKRVIVDTNCWISFLIGRKLSSLVTLLSDERIELVLCNELLEEIKEVTQRPKFAKYFPEYLVTGDKDLLVIREIASCRIVDVKTFEAAFL